MVSTAPSLRIERELNREMPARFVAMGVKGPVQALCGEGQLPELGVMPDVAILRTAPPSPLVFDCPADSCPYGSTHHHGTPRQPPRHQLVRGVVGVSF